MQIRRLSLFVLLVAGAAFAGCSDADLGDVDGGASSSSGAASSSGSSSSSGGASSGGSSSGGSSSSGSSSGGATVASFDTAHTRVGCYEIGPRAGGAYIAGVPNIAALTEAGALAADFATGGVTTLPAAYSSSTPRWFTGSALDGLGTGAFAFGRETPSNSGNYAHLFDSTGVFDSEEFASLPGATGSYRADSTGDLFASGATTTQGGFAAGVFRVARATGDVTLFSGQRAGAGPFEQIGPLKSGGHLEHYEGKHYVVGVAATDEVRALYAFLDNAEVEPAFARIPVEADKSVTFKVGPTRIYIITDRAQIAGFDRATGASVASLAWTLPSPALAAAVDEADRLYVVDQTSALVRYTTAGALDASFTPEPLAAFPASDVLESAAIDLRDGSLWVTRCAQAGTQQRTSRRAR